MKSLSFLFVFAILSSNTCWGVSNRDAIACYESLVQQVKFKIKGLGSHLARVFRNDFIAAKEEVEYRIETTKLGEPFRGEYDVRVSNYMPPIAVSLNYAWLNRLGVMDFPVLRIIKGNAPIYHELTHVSLPNQNKFLAEGIAVYIEERWGNIHCMPTYGMPLETAFKKALSAEVMAKVDLHKFDSVQTAVDPHEGVHGNNDSSEFGLDEVIPDLKDRSVAVYLISGSFVKFLLENYPVEKFRKLYELTPLTPGITTQKADPFRYKKIFNRTLTQLQADWLEWLKTR